jgi:hypothetical protein
VAQIYNPRNLEGWINRIVEFRGMHLSSQALWETEIWRIVVPDQPKAKIIIFKKFVGPEINPKNTGNGGTCLSLLHVKKQ